MVPIGPKARHLNRDFAYVEGTANQLTHWTKIGALTGVLHRRSPLHGRLYGTIRPVARWTSVREPGSK